MRLLATAEAVDRLTQKPCSWLMHVCTGRIHWSKSLALSSPCSCKHPSTGDGNSFSLPSGNAERKSEEKMDKIEIASWEENISRCAAAFAPCHEDPTTASVWTFWLPPTSILWAHCTLIPSTSNLVSCRILTSWILSHQFGSFKSSMCLSLCTALKSLHLMQCLKPEACRRFRSWTGTCENDSRVKKNCFNGPMSAMHVLARWSLQNDLHRVSVFVCVRILHCFHSAHWKSRCTWCGIASLPAVTVLSLARNLRWSTNQAWAS